MPRLIKREKFVLLPTKHQPEGVFVTETELLQRMRKLAEKRQERDREFEAFASKMNWRD